MSLFIDEIIEENAKLKEENKHLFEEYKILGEEWDKLLKDKVLYSSLLQKFKKVIKILKRELNFAFVDESQKIIIDDSISWDMLNISPNQEDYKLLKEVFANE